MNLTCSVVILAIEQCLNRVFVGTKYVRPLDSDLVVCVQKEVRQRGRRRPNRMKVSSEIPSAEVLTDIKQKKKVSGLEWVNSVLIKHIYIFMYLHN